MPNSTKTTKLSKEEADANWDRMKAVVSGTGNMVTDTVRYPALGANWGMNQLGIRSDEEAQRASNQINGFMDNPPFLSNEMNEERNRLEQQHPWFSVAGEFVGGAGIAKALLKKGINVGVKNGKKTAYRNRLTGKKAYQPATYFGAAAAGTAANEAVTEPTIDELNRWGKP